MFDTPLYKLIQNKNSIYIKRDDLIPFSFGGNKARKAFNFFKDIEDGDYGAIVTYGSSSSNHCRIVSNMAKLKDIPCYIISPEESCEPTYNNKMMVLFEAEITIVPVNIVHDTIENKLKSLSELGKKPYFIPGGGHGNFGTQAYVNCYEEIREYEINANIHFDYIFFASGTGTTQAGLVCGQLIYGDERKIVGISIARKNPIGRQVVIDSVKNYIDCKNVKVSDNLINNVIFFIDDYIGDGYAKNDYKVINTIRDMLEKYGIPMDSTYTAKAYSGMLDYIEKEKIEDKNILFIHTGGTPLFFDDLVKLL